jgi:hypothetical protein
MPAPTSPTIPRKHNWLGILSIVAFIVSIILDYNDQGAFGSALLFVAALLGVLGLIETKNNRSYTKTAPAIGLVMVMVFLIICVILAVVLINAFRTSYRF